MISVQDKVYTEIRPLPITFTADDLFFLPDEDSKKHEVIGGKLFTMSRAAHINHQILATRLAIKIGLYLENNPIGEIIAEPGIIFTKEDAVIPDLVFATNKTLEKCVNKSGKFEGKFNSAPELIIEILSVSKTDIERDRIYKRALYSEQKVQEYWIVNGVHSTIEVYKLNEKGLDLDNTYRLGEEIKTEILEDFVLQTVDIFRF